MSRTTRTLQTSRLLKLPAELLQAIFEPVYRYWPLEMPLCRKLLPLHDRLRAKWNKKDKVDGTRMLSSFCFSLALRPTLGEMCQSFTVCDPGCRLLDKIPTSDLNHLFSSLPNLRNLDLSGLQVVSSFLSFAKSHRGQLLPNLSSLNLSAFTEQAERRYPLPVHGISKLHGLKAFTFSLPYLEGTGAPVSPGLSALHKLSFAIDDSLDVVAHLVKAATSLRTLLIGDYSSDSKLDQVLGAAAALGSVTALQVDGDSSGKQWKLSKEIKKFRSLESLHLGEGCSARDATSFAILHRLPLKNLHFKPNTTVSAAHLRTLISGRDKISTFQNLTLDNVAASYQPLDVTSRSRTYLRSWLTNGCTLPKWTKTFSRDGFEELLSAAEAEGVTVGGSAAQACDIEDTINDLKERAKSRIEACKEAEAKAKAKAKLSGGFNPNAGSFVPGGAPPFQPGQPYNPYGAPPQQGGNPADYYNQYAGGYGGYGAPAGQYGYAPQGYGQAPAGYGAQDPFAARYNNGGFPGHQQQQQRPPQQPETRVYEPPVRQPAASSAPFVRPSSDPNAPPPSKPPTVSLKIGGSSSSILAPNPDAKPATVSLKIGGGSKASTASSSSAAASKNATPATSSKASTPAASKPGTPVAGKPAAAAAAEKKADAAQAKKEDKEKKVEAKKVEEAKKDAVEAEIQAVADQEALEDLYGVEDAKDVKPHMNIVFIGHVDAGKSTMGGNILYLCGMVDKRTLEKYEREAKEAGRESWYLSWALDSTSQEREKGKTVEVGRAYFETDVRRYTILDAPGHKNFVPSMISGAAQADVAVLVISARKGEFETGFEKGGQTREHAMLVKTAGVQKLVVVVNKMDDPTVNWDKARYDEIVTKLSPFLKGTGYNMKTDVTFIPVSGFTGANIKEPVDRKVAPWVEGTSLLSFLDEMPLMDRKNNAPLMMPISEKYGDMGCVVVGKVESGKVRKNQDLLLMPNKTPVQVAAIFNEMEEEVSLALCGDNVRIRLRGIEDTDVNVGFVLTDPKKPVSVVTQFEAQLVILDTKNIITAGYSAVMHVHTASEEVTLSALLNYYDKKTGRKSRRPPQFAKKGMKIIARIDVAGPISLEKFSDHPQLGRFTLRDEGKTVAIGKVTKTQQVISEEAPDVAKLDINVE
ncbi:translation termination factor GTPase eRF3 [Rhodotorula toruloides]